MNQEELFQKLLKVFPKRGIPDNLSSKQTQAKLDLMSIVRGKNHPLLCECAICTGMRKTPKKRDPIFAIRLPHAHKSWADNNRQKIRIYIREGLENE